MHSKMRTSDLAVVLLALAIGIGAYVWSVRTPVAGGTGTPRFEWVSVEIQLGSEQVWMREFIQPGLRRLDPRSNEPVAEVVGIADAPGGTLLVAARVRAGFYPDGRVLFDAKPLLPGQTIRIETPRCVIEGRLRSTGQP